MKTWALFLASFAFPSSLLAQDIQVRIYSAHPLSALTVSAIEGHLHWKACATCQEQTGESLSVESPKANPSASPKAVQQEFLITGTYRLRPVSPANGPDFSSPYPLRIQSPPGGLIIVATIPLEQYVQHVLMAESGNFRNPEALKAMAVAARSYANKFIGQHAKEGFDFCDTTHCQVFYWRNITPPVRGAAETTRGESLSYQGKPAAAFYTQNCGGTTAAAAKPGRRSPRLTSPSTRIPFASQQADSSGKRLSRTRKSIKPCARRACSRPKTGSRSKSVPATTAGACEP